MATNDKVATELTKAYKRERETMREFIACVERSPAETKVRLKTWMAAIDATDALVAKGGAR